MLFSPRNALHLAQMDEHRGKILENAIREKGYSFAAAAKRMSISRRTLYNYFEDPELAWQKLIEFDKVLILGLTQSAPKMKKYLAHTTIDAGKVNEGDSDYWKNKYIDLLEKYTQLLEDKR